MINKNISVFWFIVGCALLQRYAEFQKFLQKDFNYAIHFRIIVLWNIIQTRNKVQKISTPFQTNVKK